MNKKTISYISQLFVFSGILFAVHYYLISQFFNVELYFPIWTIYLFNIVLVLIVFLVLTHKSVQEGKKGYQYFVGLTTLKMVLAIVFLSPLFFEKSEHQLLEVVNFFIPYFLFLGFEIFKLNKFLQSS